MKFTYKKIQDFSNAVAKGYIESYDMVRVTTMNINGDTFDYPIHSEEELQKHIPILLNNHDIISIGIEPSTHSYDIQDYID